MKDSNARHDNNRYLFVRLARLHFLVPGALLYVLGALLAIANGAVFEPGPFILGYIIFFLAQISMHFSNDYFDREADKGGQPTSVSGGSGVLVTNPELAPAALSIAVLLLSASIITAVAFTWFYSFPPAFLAFAVLGSLLGWFYAAPPLRLAYREWGEVATAIAVGLIMPGMGYFVVSGTIDLWFALISLPLLCYGLFFIVTVEMPDIEADRLARKENLLVRHGLRAGTRIAFIATGLAAALLFIIAYTGALGTIIDFWLVAWFSLILMVIAGYGAFREQQRREQVLSQVKLNFESIMSLLVFFLAVCTSALLF